jgi:hypothetical protein
MSHRVDSPYPPIEAFDHDPISEVRPVGARARRLVVDTGLRGAAAAEAWVTVTDVNGALCFEGMPGEDGCLDMSFPAGEAPDRVVVHLETARLHRSAEVTLREGWNAHAFG